MRGTVTTRRFLLAFFLLAEISHAHVLPVASEAVGVVAIKAPIISKDEICTTCLGLRKLLPFSPSPLPGGLRQGVAEIEEDGGGGNGAENRIGGGGSTCSTEDIDVYEGPTEPLPNGIPTYTVNIVNVCDTGCSISNIHLSCGWFSTARLINPNLFRRLSYNDCLVNNGEPLAHGQSLSFLYANSFHYPLAVSSLTCV